MTEAYPPVSFYFQLTISGISGQTDTSFKEVSGISMEMGLEEIAEGGVNGYKHKVPTSAKFTNLVLRRGLVPKNSELATWCTETISGGLEEVIQPKNIIVNLLDENGAPLKSWSFVNAWPVKWEVSNFNSMENNLAIETLEFAYNYFEIK